MRPWSLWPCFALSALLTACWSPPEACSHGKKPSGIWAEEGFPLGKAAVCDRSSDTVLAVAQKGAPPDVTALYSQALEAKGYTKIGVDAAQGSFRWSYRKQGTVISGSFADSNGTSVELSVRASCAIPAAQLGERYRDLEAALGPDKGYLCVAGDESVVLLVPGGSFEEACSQLAMALKPRGYRGNAPRKRYYELQTKDFRFGVSPGEPLFEPATWTRVIVRSTWPPR